MDVNLGCEDLPFAFVVYDEFEHAVSIGSAEGHAVRARLVGYSRNGGSDMRVEHGKLQLKVLDVRLGDVLIFNRIELRDFHGEGL